MGVVVAELVANLTANTSDFVSGMKTAQRGMDGVEKSAKSLDTAQVNASKSSSILKTGMLALGGVGAVALGKQILDAGSSLNESLSKVNVVFDDMGSNVIAWSKTSASAMGISQRAALEAAGTFGNLFQAMGVMQGPSTDMSKNLVQLASDLASFNNANPEEVLEALRSGVVGEAEPLRRFGISISAARIEAEALSMGLAKGNVDLRKVEAAQLGVEKAMLKAAETSKKYGKDSIEARDASAAVGRAQDAVTKAMAGSKVELNEAQKAQAAYSLIMKDSKLAQGDFERTSGGLANQQRILAAQIENVKARVGGALIPIFLKAIKIVRDVSHWVMEHREGLRDLALAIAPVVAGFVAFQVISKVSEGIKAMRTAMIALNIAMSANPAILITAALVALVAGIVIAYKRFSWFRNAVDAVGRALMAAFDWVKSHWRLLLAILTGPFGAAIAIIITHRDKILAAVRFVVDWIRNNWPLLLAVLTGPFGIAVLLIKRNFDKIQAFASTLVDKIVGFFLALPGRLLALGGDLLVAGVSLGAKILEGIGTGIREGFNAALDFAGVILEAFKGAWNWLVDKANTAWNAIEFEMPFPPHKTVGLPDDTLLALKLARGAYIRRRPGGVLANIGEGAYDEVVAPVMPGGRLGGPLAGVGGPIYVSLYVETMPTRDQLVWLMEDVRRVRGNIPATVRSGF